MVKLGKAFSDSITRDRRKVSRGVNEESRLWWLGTGRLLMFLTIFSVALFVLLWRLFDVTVIHGHEYRALADGNRTRELVRRAPRGALLDRTGKPLVANIPYWRLLKPCEGTDGSDCIVSLSQEEGQQLAAEGLPAGYFLEQDWRRQYIHSTNLSHVVGYIGEITEDELADEFYALHQYRAGDRIGRTGAEAVFEDRLRGRDGRELVEVDASGAIVRTLGTDREIAGTDVTLSIDANLQKTAASSFPEGEKGAIIVSKPSTGEILALYSSPSYDINAFSRGLSDQQYTALTDDPAMPMFDRGIGGVYPPGSTFKIVTALAALEEGAIKSDTTVEDVGVLSIGPFSFPNWYFNQYGRKEGIVDIVKAMKRSNDIFFYKTGEWLGITKLAAWARKVGVGKPLGIELGGEASGLMPDPAWKKEHFDTETDRAARNDEWYLGDTYHVSIGQGYLLVTPLQVNAWTNLVANGGSLCPPTIEKREQRAEGREQDCKDLGVKKETIDLIAEGMVKACQTGGTGWPLFGFTVHRSSFIEDTTASSSALPSTMNNEQSTLRVPVACKTGTAEFGDPKDRTHAWFTAFAPVPESFAHGTGQAPQSAGDALQDHALRDEVLSGEPEISVTVLVEGAGEGSSVAAPIAKKIFEEWFSR